MYERYVNNKILNASVRPSRRNWCSISAMTAAFNAVFSMNIGVEDARKAIGWDVGKIERGSIGNLTFIDGLNTMCQKYGQLGKIQILFQTIDVGEENIERAWQIIKQKVQDESCAVIYHMDNRFTLVAGFYEEAADYDSIGGTGFLDRNDWLVIAENSTFWNYPIRVEKWYDVREDLRNHDNRILMVLEAK